MRKSSRKICFLLVAFLLFQPFIVFAASPSPSPSPSPIITKHIYANGEAIATIREQSTATSSYIIHTDHLTGSNIITDKDAKVAEVLDYYPYGDIRLNTKYTSLDEQRKFAGYEYDTATDLNYLGARYYPAKIARFLSQDPAFQNLGQQNTAQTLLSNPQRLNSYSYSLNNPLIYIDPNGEEAVLISAYVVFQVYVAPILIPAAIAGVAAIGAGISAWYYGKGVGQAVEGDIQGSQQSFDTVQTTQALTAGAAGGLLQVGEVLMPAAQSTPQIINLKGTQNPEVKQTTIIGKEAHKQQQYPGFEKEVSLPSGKRMDAYNKNKKIIIELKPNNPRAIQRGYKQLEQYCKECDSVYGEGHIGTVETYNPEDIKIK